VGLINQMMTFLEDKLSIIAGPYEDLISIEDVIEQGQILFVSLREGGYRVPCFIRWPGVVKPGTIVNDIGARRHVSDTASGSGGCHGQGRFVEGEESRRHDVQGSHRWL